MGEGFDLIGMSSSSGDEAEWPSAPEEAPPVYCVSYRVASGSQSVACSAAGDAMLIASRSVQSGATDVRAACDGVVLTLAELGEMASCERHGLIRPDLVWSG